MKTHKLSISRVMLDLINQDSIMFKDYITNDPRGEGLSTLKFRVEPSTSEVSCGRVNWAKFCWDGSAEYVESWDENENITFISRAPLPWIDNGNLNYQYLHVPWNWPDQQQIFRIYPKWDVGDHLLLSARGAKKMEVEITAIELQRTGTEWFWILRIKRKEG